LRAVYVSGQYGVILPANFLKEKEGVKLKVYNNVENFTEGQKKKNTKMSAERNIRNFQRWLVENKNEHRFIQNIEVPVLND
jgi:hypothetical protein